MDLARVLGQLGFNATPAPDADVGYLDEVLLDQGLLRVLPAAELAKIPDEHLRLWCHYRAVYTIPSQEMVEWLREKVAGRPALEIGCGNGAVGRALGIRITDSKLQDDPQIKLYYASLGQPTIDYPADVEKRNANAAVRIHKPEVVVGCWITHLYRAEDHDRGGNMYGVDEAALLARVKCYIHFGSEASHGKKRILSEPHEKMKPDWLFGRGQPGDRVIYVWESRG